MIEGWEFLITQMAIIVGSIAIVGVMVLWSLR